MTSVIIALQVYFIGFVVAVVMATLMKLMMMVIQKTGAKKHPANNE